MPDNLLLTLVAAAWLLASLAPTLAFAQDDYEGDEPGECTDRADNDRDGKFDCNDEGCAGSPDCAEPKAASPEEAPTKRAGAPGDQREEENEANLGNDSDTAPQVFDDGREPERGHDSRDRRSSELDGATKRRVRSAFFRLNEARGSQVGGGVLFGTGIGVLIGGTVVAWENEEAGLALGLAGVAQIGFSMGFVGGAASRAANGLGLYGLRGKSAPITAGLVMQGIGVLGGSIAVVDIYAKDHVDPTNISVAIFSLSMAIAGHVVGQAGVGQWVRSIESKRDGELFEYSRVGRRPRLLACGLAPLREGAFLAIGGDW